MEENKSNIDIYVEEIELKMRIIEEKMKELQEEKRRLQQEIPAGYYTKKHYDRNREAILQKKKEKYQREKDLKQEYICAGCCFKTDTKGSFNRHLKTKRHMKIYPDEISHDFDEN